MSIGSKFIRYVATFASIILMGALTFIFAETWMYGWFPSTCPFGKYLPDGSTTIECEYDGFVDFSVEFQAKGTVDDFKVFIENLRRKLPNLELNGQFHGAVNDVSIPQNSQVILRDDTDTYARLSWSDDVISMTYVNF